jgi:hypothetical protein
MMVFDKNIAIIESIQDWQEIKKDSRTWLSKVSIFSGKESSKIA